ncbi:MAG TPA: hypothetical protein VFT68_11755 [Lapillicoccus sp.]|nr:hypothetical protein [Lapillicoccus sp.]
MSGAFARYAFLAVLSAVTAEFLLGDQYLSVGSPAGQVAELVLYVAYYGSAAVVIREVTRRAGRGWPTILLLAFAFGVVEEGLLTQSLFDPDYLGLHKLAYGYLPSLGIGLPWTIFVLALHTIWSISAPIAVAEALFPGRAPWLGPRPVAGLAALYLLTGAVIAVGSAAATTFRPSAAQLVVTVVVALAVVAAAFGMRRVPADSPASGSGLVGAVLTFVLLSLFHLGHEAGPAWFACTVMLVTLALLGFALWRRRFPPGAVGAGAVGVYAWVGLANAAEHGAAAVAEQVVIIVLVLAAVAVALRPRPRTRTPRDASSSSRR